MLRVNGIKTYHGRIAAVHGVSFQVPPASVVALIGANGAGKTTTLKTIAGLLRPRDGSITYKGKPIHVASPQDIVRNGIVLVPEGRELFREMTVRENILMGAYLRSDRAEIARDEEWVYEKFPILKDYRRKLAGLLSGGQQQVLAIARALMARPSLLMLDEPSLGLAPKVVDDLFDTLLQIIEERRTAVLLVEQNVSLALSVSSYAYVMENGEIRLEGPAETLLHNDTVQEHYLGKGISRSSGCPGVASEHMKGGTA